MKLLDTLALEAYPIKIEHWGHYWHIMVGPWQIAECGAFADKFEPALLQATVQWLEEQDGEQA